MIYELPPPKNEDIFEDMMCDLWKSILEDPNTQKVGRRGQAQKGVDIIGQNKNSEWVGIQCRKKGPGKQLNEGEIESLIEEAKTFRPQLSEYNIVTTAPKDASLEEFVRKNSEENKSKKLFKVSLLGWEWANLMIQKYPDILKDYYPGVSPEYKETKKEIENIKSSIEEKATQVLKGIGEMNQNLENSNFININKIIDEVKVDEEYQKEIDYSKKLLKDYKPKESLGFLEDLKERVWNKASNLSKFRILANIGVSKMLLGNESGGGRLLIQALQYNEKAEKALTNAALGYLLNEEYKEAGKLIKKVLKVNPYSTPAYSLKIGLFSKKEMKIDKILKEIPADLKKEMDIAYSIGHFELKNKNYSEAEKWFGRALRKDGNAQIKEALGSTIIERIHKSSNVFRLQLNKSEIAQLNKAIALLEEAWDVYKKSEMRNNKIYCLSNIAIAHNLMGDYDNAEEALKASYSIAPKNPFINMNLGILLFKYGKFKESIKHLEQTISPEDYHYVKIYLGISFYETGDYKKAEKHLKEFLKIPKLKENEKLDALLLLLNVITKQNKSVKTSELKEKYNLSRPLELIIEAKQFKIKSDREEAIKYLAMAYKEVEDNSILYIIADELYWLDEYAMVIEIYEKLIEPGKLSKITERLVFCYYQTGELNKAFELAKKIRRKYGLIESIAEIEISILEYIGDLPGANALCEEFLKTFSKNLKISIKQALINLRLRNVEKVKNLISKIMIFFSFEESSPQEIIYLTIILAEVEEVDKAIKLMYKCLRLYPGDPEVHSNYINLLILYKEDDKNLLEIETADINIAVGLQDEEKNIRWRIIEEENPDISKEELDPHHTLAQRLIGKQIGDKILLSDSGYQKTYGIIVELKHKYIYALHKSMQRFQENFPDVKRFLSLKIDKELLKKGNISEAFKPILQTIDERNKQRILIKDLYLKGKLTLGAIAQIMGGNPLNVFEDLTKGKEITFICSSGENNEKENAFSELEKKPKVIIDITTAIILTELDVWKLIIENFAEIGVSQSTKDLIYSILEETKRLGLRQRGILGKKDDKYFMHEVKEDEIKKSIKSLEKIIDSVEKHTSVIPCYKILEIQKKERLEMEEFLGKSFFDSLLLVSDSKDFILCSEDKILRSFGEKQYKTPGVWTQVVLLFLKDKGIISSNEYSEKIVKLLDFNMRHFYMDSNTLLLAADKSDWNFDKPFNKACETLNGYNSNQNSAIQVAIEFLLEIWDAESISRVKKDHLVTLILDNLVKGRNRGLTLNAFSEALKRRSIIAPSYISEIKQILEAWRSTHIV